MGKTSQAVDTLDRLAVQLAGITEAAEQLRKIGSYEGAIEALTAQRDALQSDTAKAKNELEAIQARITTAKDAGGEIVETAMARAEKLVKDAEAKTAVIIKSAAEQAALDLQADKAGREDRLKTLTKQLADATKKLTAIQESTAKATQEAEAVERRTAAAQEALEKIQAAAKAIGGA